MSGNQTIVVTGASRGLGEHFAAALIQKGATVFGLARSEVDLTRLREQLGERFHPVVCDVTDPEAVARAFAHVHDEANSLDILINNAGLRPVRGRGRVAAG